MAGDSITAQRLHTNYIEAFYRTRYPTLNLRFRNSGIGGNKTGNILARFDYDVAAWKPAIVSIELGMNDVGAGDDPAAYIKGMKELIQKIRDIKAQPVLISSSPVNDGSLPGDWKSDRCRRIEPYTNALKKLAEEEGVVCVDQYHPLLELWGTNMAKAEAARRSFQSSGAQRRRENVRQEIINRLDSTSWRCRSPGSGGPVHDGGYHSRGVACRS